MGASAVIRVLSIIHYPTFGGPHNANRLVGSVLKAQGIETIVLLPDEPGNAASRFREAGVEVIATPLGRIRAKLNPLYHLRLGLRFISDVRRIRRIIRERQVNLVQINGLVNAQGAVAARLEGVPVVWQIVDTFAPMIVRRVMMRVVRLLADVVMSTGMLVAEAHPGAVRFGQRLVLFYPPVDLGRFVISAERRDSAREELGLRQDAFVVGNVGNVNPQKGHGTFIRAAARLKEQVPTAQFVILGAQHDNHRAYAERLWEEAKTLGLDMGTDLIVRDAGNRVAELEPAFDVFWMTSEPRSEGIPTAVEEAMALGIPVVATDVGSVSEIVSDGETGFLVPAHDEAALVERTLRLYSDQDMRAAMGQATYEFAVSKVSKEQCAQTHRHAYEMARNRKRVGREPGIEM